MTDQTGIILVNTKQVPDTFAEVYDYWELQRGPAWAPTWSDFRLDELPFPILPWSIVVDVEANSTEFLYRFWGTQRTKLIGKDMTGETSSSIPNSFMREGNIKEYLEVCNQKKPMLFDTPVVKESGLRATFQSIRLPLSDDGKSVSKIFSALNYQLVSEAHYEFYDTGPRKAGSQWRGSR